MAGIIGSVLFSMLKRIVSKKVVEELALLAIKEIAKYTENSVDDRAVKIIEDGLKKVN